jgi:N,N'-diacetyllegionaminate synthase
MKKKIFIIAEAGVNHNGSIKLAKKMVDKASQAGADAIKFQTFKAERVISKFAPKAGYQKKNTRKSESQLEMVRNLELSLYAHKELINYCHKKGILFLSSPFDLESIDLLNRLGLKIFKVPSGEITNLPYLRKIGSLKKKIILSTGMSNLKEINKALGILIKAGTNKENITVLHCNTEYPTPMKDVNLKAMLTIKKALGVKVGYSDHTLGIEIPVAAVALGAEVIEKHFTLDKNMAGPDHKASLEPDEFKEMVKAIRNIESALGSGIKKASPSELKNRVVVRKSIVAIKDIKKGELFREGNISVKRPASGISPILWDKVMGKVAKKNFKKDQPISL